MSLESLKQSLSVLTGRNITFNADGLISRHGADFLSEPRFRNAYEQGTARYGRSIHIEWRVRVAIWAAMHGAKLEGDFVECGVNTGILAGATMDYLHWQNVEKTYYLLDTFHGIPTAGLSPSSLAAAKASNTEYGEVYEIVREHFSKYKNVEIIRGEIPDTLARVTSPKIAYLSVDLNIPEPEMAVAAYFWPKMASGAMILLDDYNYAGYELQRTAWNEFAREQDVDILPLPTGQGLIIKPPSS